MPNVVNLRSDFEGARPELAFTADHRVAMVLVIQFNSLMVPFIIMTGVGIISLAGVTRLRPVMLTAMTTIIGLIPMAVGVSYDFHTFTWATKSESTQWWRNMAVVVMFGLGFATILTLVVVPSLYVMLRRLSLWLDFGRARADRTSSTPRSEVAGAWPS